MGTHTLLDYLKLNLVGLHLAWFIPLANMGLFPREEYEKQFSPAINVPFGLRGTNRFNAIGKIAPISYTIVLVLPLFLDWKAQGFSRPARFFMWFAPIAISSMEFLCFTQVSHVQPEVQVAEDHPADDFFKHQALTSVDYSCTSKFWSIMSGGLNTQSLHHCCPNVSSCHYSELFPKFEKIANKHGVQIAKRRNLLHSITSSCGYVWKINNSIDLLKGMFEPSSADAKAAKKVRGNGTWHDITVVQQTKAMFNFLVKGNKKQL
jgi:fatty acid desaturase